MRAFPENVLDRLGRADLGAWHHQHGAEIDEFEYHSRHLRLLENGLSRSRIAYLDTNFWVRLRQAHIGHGSRDGVQLLEMLRSLVRTRELICVGQMYQFLEISKQHSKSLRATASLLDQLTEGVVLASTPDLQRFECSEFVREVTGLDVGDGLGVWTRAGLMHRNAIPKQIPEKVSPTSKGAVLKSVVDALWNTSYEDLFEAFDWNPSRRLPSFQTDTQTLAGLGSLKQSRLASRASKSDVLRFEFSSAFESQYSAICRDLIFDWHSSRGFPAGALEAQRQLSNVRDAAGESDWSGGLKRRLASLSIQVFLFTLHEQSAQRRPITENDWSDWNHAAAALPYADVFLTERHLAHQLRQEMRADVVYGCQVIGSISEALEVLTQPSTHMARTRLDARMGRP